MYWFQNVSQHVNPLLLIRCPIKNWIKLEDVFQKIKGLVISKDLYIRVKSDHLCLNFMARGDLFVEL